MVGLNGDQCDCVNWRLHIGVGIACFDASFHFLSFGVDCRQAGLGVTNGVRALF